MTTSTTTKRIKTTKMRTRPNAGADEGLTPSAPLAVGLLAYTAGTSEAAEGRRRIKASVTSWLTLRVDSVQGRDEPQPALPETDPEMDQDAGDLPTGVDADALDRDELDTDRVTRTEALAASLRIEAMRHGAEGLHHLPK